jgi:hypothetical protein
LLFSADGTIYNQTLILNDKFEVDPRLLAQQGLVCHVVILNMMDRLIYHCLAQPFYAGTWVAQLLASNLGLGATFTHLLIWNYSDIMGVWSWMSPPGLRLMYQNFNWRFWTDDGMRKQTDSGELDPHYHEMLKVIV